MQKVLSIEEVRNLCKGPVCLAIGMFDGVHLGHQTVIGELVAQARALEGTAVVLTFWPHPAKVVSGDPEAKQMLMDSDVRKQALQYMGVDVLVELPFDEQLSQVTAEAFLEQIIYCMPKLQCVYVGETFHFGYQRSGDVKMIKKYGKKHGFELKKVNPVLYHSEAISSTAVRELIRAGDLEKANALLGYNYYSEAKVAGDNSLAIDWIGEMRMPCGHYGVSLNFGQHKEFYTTGHFDSKTKRLKIADTELLSASKSTHLQVSWLHVFKGEPQQSKLEDWVSWHAAGRH